jgi:tripartite-type tricarboxylate transporter receptor subunit TctC
MISRRSVIAAAGVLAAPGILGAQPRPVRMLVGFAPGGAADTIARLVAPGMGEALGRSIVVENRSGASGTIAAAAVAQSAPDGETVLFATLTHATNRFLFRDLPFDYATAFTPISQVVEWPQILAVRNGFAAETIGAFLDLSRQARITYGTPGNATAQHLAGEMLRLRTGAMLEHVPYRGGADAARDLAGGVIDAAFMTTSTALPYVSGNRVRMLAAATPRRLAAYPQTPTIAESGVPGFALTDWCALFGPAGLSTGSAERIHAALRHALAQPDVIRRIEALSSPPVASAPPEFAAFLAAESERLGEVIRSARISLG